MGTFCCMYINEFQDDQQVGDELAVDQAEKDFTPEEAAVLED